MSSKSRRHHNRNGLRQIKKGSLARNTKRLAKRLGIPYGNPTKHLPDGAIACPQCGHVHNNHYCQKCSFGYS